MTARAFVEKAPPSALNMKADCVEYRTADRTAARVVRGLSRSPHTTSTSLMDADIVTFLLCLLEEGDEPAEDQEVSLEIHARARRVSTVGF